LASADSDLRDAPLARPPFDPACETVSGWRRDFYQGIAILRRDKRIRRGRSSPRTETVAALRQIRNQAEGCSPCATRASRLLKNVLDGTD
jgi:hypothetical protein